jgi:D-serine deaminase-like pyridoxal phosphate-dependent protein
MSAQLEQADVGVGSAVEDLDTPALLIDLDAMERNIQQIAAQCAQYGVGWRPHTKGLKVPAVARRCIEAGAIGVTCAKVAEAEWLVEGGIDHILIANQVIGAAKLDRVARLRRQADVIFAVDSAEGLAQASAAGVRNGVDLAVVVEVDTGMARCGVAPGEATLAFARQVERATGVKLVGLEGWEGHATSVTDVCEKEQVIQTAVGQLVSSAELCREFGLPIEIVSAGGTATYMQSTKIAGVTEVQAGGGVYGDRTYVGRWGAPLEIALNLLVTVISRPIPTRIVTDAGRKAQTADMGGPLLKDVPNVESYSLHAEHGVVTLSEPSDTPKVGDKLRVIPGYGDWTVFLHDTIFAHRNGRVEEVWPVAPRSSYR